MANWPKKGSECMFGKVLKMLINFFWGREKKAF